MFFCVDKPHRRDIYPDNNELSSSPLRRITESLKSFFLMILPTAVCYADKCFVYSRPWCEDRVQDMIHELIDPRKKTNKTITSRITKTLQDYKHFSDQCNFEPSDSENKDAESSSTTFIPPWLRNSLGLNHRNNQSHAAVGHSEQKPAKVFHKYKEPIQSETHVSKTAVDDDSCKNVTNQFGSLPSNGPQIEAAPTSTDAAATEREKALSMRWQLKQKDSETDSSGVVEDTKSSDKEDPKMSNGDGIDVMDSGKTKEDEKKKMRFVKSKSRTRKRGTNEHKIFEALKNEAECPLETKARGEAQPFSEKRGEDVSSETKQLESRLVMIGAKGQEGNTPRDEHIGNIGDFARLIGKVKEDSMRELMKNSDFLINRVGDEKVVFKDERSAREKCEEGKSNLDKDSLLSTDDENDIKRFSEFLSKNKNMDEKRKCLEEVRNYFERKRRTRMSKRRYLEEVKNKLPGGLERRDEVLKERMKCRELFTFLPSRGKRSKFALCDEEVVEKAVDETLQKFVELYHFHVSPTVMGNMKKNILQAMHSDSMESCSSKPNVLDSECRALGKKPRNETSRNSSKYLPKGEIKSFDPAADSQEVPNKEIFVHKDVKKKNFKTVLMSSSETLQKPSKEIDVVENERLKRLNKDFDVFLHSIQNHVDFSNLKIQSVVFEREEQAGSSKHLRFVYNFSKKALDLERASSSQETQIVKSFQEIGIQVSMKKESKRSVRVQAVEYQSTFSQSLQTEETKCTSQSAQTEDTQLPFRELKELKGIDISPGLYRMVKSKEAGKFYLYPEQLDDGKGEMIGKSDSSVLKDRKANRKKGLVNIVSKERTKERRVYFKDRERMKLRKNRRAVYTVTHFKNTSRREKSIRQLESEFQTQMEAEAEMRAEIKAEAAVEMAAMMNAGGKSDLQNERSVNCLYFRNFDGDKSESQQSRREVISKNELGGLSGNLGLGDAQEGGAHMGCFWFWNGERISPGCDLKMRVENLLREKLKEIADVDFPHNKYDVNRSKMESGIIAEGRNSSKACEAKTTSVFRMRSVMSHDQGESRFNLRTEKANMEQGRNIDEKHLHDGEGLHDKVVRNVATQNSQQTIRSLGLTKTRTQSKATIDVPKKKRGTQGKSVHRKLASLKKAEGIMRAIEEIKKLQIELENLRQGDMPDSDSLLGTTSSSSDYKNDTENPLSMVLGFRENSKVEISTSSLRNRLKVGRVDHQVQTANLRSAEDVNSEVSRGSCPVMEKQKHLELIESVLCRVDERERKSLWNDVRDFIKTKMGRDINDEGAREVCIEIEQDVPRNMQGPMKQAVMARGHYVRNEGDVEVEIDLTLDDLEKILRQRQRKIRRQHRYRRKHRRFISSSSAQSDLTRDDMRRYQRYLNRFAALGGQTTEKPSVSFKKSKGN